LSLGTTLAIPLLVARKRRKKGRDTMTTTTQQPTITVKRSTLNPDDRILVVSPADYACRCGSTLSERIAYVGNGVCRCESCGTFYAGARAEAR
jgi:hypothetical protein